ncbi:unnamed protein product [Allacma fusca]|uniref:UDP-glucuronosyltransferase n=1 Tax=Allacma fusca TaxID=39272 RepID=A0A8J2KK65_9HEXA|nr:unnamed protein product [Allacma fusca]
MQLLLSFYVAILLVFQVSSGAKILFLIGLGSHSHRVAVQPLASKLADRGHDVTFVSARIPESVHPKIKELSFEKPFQAILESNDDITVPSVETRLKTKYIDYLLTYNNMWDVFYASNEVFLEDREFIKFIKETHFDVIIGDFVMKETVTVMAHFQNTKVIWFNSGGAQFMVDMELLGLPTESSWLPDFSLGSPYSFVPNRFVYAFNSLWWYFSFHWYFLPKVNQLVEKNLGGGLPSFDEMVSNVDLVFVNEHFSHAYPRSLPPFVIPIGGMHCLNSNGTLPKSMETFIESVDSFVYMSFGSIINVTGLPDELQNVLFDTVGSFPGVKFLWKWDGKLPANFPKNVLPMEWFPQQDVLAHPKCKGFVTQGGAMSFQQAIYHGVPMIVVPVWWDQPSMARIAMELGVGIHLELSEITRDSFRDALTNIIYNKKYSEKSKLISQLSKDRPMAPVETAVWWTEYVLKHDTAHLKSPAIKQRWWQRRMLDFWMIVFLFALIAATIIYKVVALVHRTLTISPKTLQPVNQSQSKVKRS